jgi:hypothetical protein
MNISSPGLTAQPAASHARARFLHRAAVVIDAQVEELVGLHENNQPTPVEGPPSPLGGEGGEAKRAGPPPVGRRRSGPVPTERSGPQGGSGG